MCSFVCRITGQSTRLRGSFPALCDSARSSSMHCHRRPSQFFWCVVESHASIALCITCCWRSIMASACDNAISRPAITLALVGALQHRPKGISFAAHVHSLMAISPVLDTCLPIQNPMARTTVCCRAFPISFRSAYSLLFGLCRIQFQPRIGAQEWRRVGVQSFRTPQPIKARRGF